MRACAHVFHSQVFGDDDELDSDVDDDLQGTAFYLIMAQKDHTEADQGDNNNNDGGDDNDDKAPAASSSRASKGASE